MFKNENKDRKNFYHFRWFLYHILCNLGKKKEKERKKNHCADWPTWKSCFPLEYGFSFFVTLMSQSTKLNPQARYTSNQGAPGLWGDQDQKIRSQRRKLQFNSKFQI